MLMLLCTDLSKPTSDAQKPLSTIDDNIRGKNASYNEEARSTQRC